MNHGLPAAAPLGRDVLAADGHPIAARFRMPAHAPRASVLVVPAMGVPQSYYDDFAAWLVGQGFAVATFDYRGMGDSRRGGLRGFGTDILDWARLDCAAMVDATAALAPDRPLHWIGHSLGGQILPFVPNRDRIARIVTVAAGSGYWRDNVPALRRKVWLLWWVAAPLLTPVFGYFPGRRLGMVGDLPEGVIRQWRRWCLSPDYVASAEGASAREQFDAVRTPIVSLSFTDDEMMSARSITSLHALYTNAPMRLDRIAPGEVGLRRIGHFGFFRAAHARPLWEARLLPALA
jgi:predicted alpha/beta hydrolase